VNLLDPRLTGGSRRQRQGTWQPALHPRWDLGLKLEEMKVRSSSTGSSVFYLVPQLNSLFSVCWLPPQLLLYMLYGLEAVLWSLAILREEMQKARKGEEKQSLSLFRLLLRWSRRSVTSFLFLVLTFVLWNVAVFAVAVSF